MISINRLDFLIGDQQLSVRQCGEYKAAGKPTAATNRSSRPTFRTESDLTEDEALFLWTVALQFARRLLGKTTIRGLSPEDMAAEAVCVICALGDPQYRKPAFARRVVHSRFVDQIRKLKSSMCYREREEYRLKASVSGESRHLRNRLDTLRREIQSLSDSDREIIQLRYTKGMSTLAIATLLKTSRRTVQLEIKRILQYLKSRL